MPAVTRVRTVLLWVLSILSVYVGAAFAADDVIPPELNGRLLFHRYTSYDSYDSHLFLYDFQDKKLTCLSEKWPVDHAMNAHFSPDGEWIVFMGMPKGRHGSKDWDIFRWKVGSAEGPENLTQGNGLRDEDPNFSPDGMSLVLKQAGKLAVLDLKTRKVQRVETETKAEQSMPVFVTGGRRIVAMENAAAGGDLYVYNLENGSRKAVAVEPGVQEYFPVPWDDDRLLYVRWNAADNHNDQVYVHHFATGKNAPLTFCKPDANYSDPCPADERWVFFSSTRQGGKGGYDLYLGDSKTGAVQSLNIDKLNTSAEELGSSYLPRPVNKVEKSISR